MFKLDRLLTVVVIFLLNICNVSSELSDFLNLLKTVGEETKISCLTTITESGVYKFVPEASETLTRCVMTIEVPENIMAFVRPSQRTCETTSSANISAVCNRPHHEEHFPDGEHHFRFDATESVTITVRLAPIIRLGCNEWFKNLHDIVNSVVIVENTDGDNNCMIRLPPAIEVRLLDFQSERPKKCCSDILMVSSDINENPIAFSESHSVCDIRSQQPTVASKCESTYLYMRRTIQTDLLLFRVAALPRETVNECEIVGDVLTPPGFACKNSKRQKNRLKNKKQH